MHKIITVTPNPALDVSAHTPVVQPVHKLRCDAVERHPGGGGVNVARVLHRLGVDVCAVYTAGGTTGSLLTELLAQEGVRCDPLAIAGHTRESFTVHDEQTRQEYRFVLPGPPVEAATASALMQRVLSQGADAGFLVASGSLPPGFSTDWYAVLARELGAAGVRVIVDTAGAPLKAALQAGVYMIKPSLREMRELVGQPLQTWEALVQASCALVQTEKLEVLVVSMGEQGALLVTAESCLYAPPIRVEVRSAVGAGDSFVAGMAWSLARGQSVQQACVSAVACGTAALASVGTGLCAVADVMRFIPQVQLQAPPTGALA